MWWQIKKKNRNNIISINSDTNSTGTGPTVVAPAAPDSARDLRNHFKSITGQLAPQSRPFEMSRKIGPQLTEELQHLDDQLSDTEIQQAVMGMSKGKVSSPNSFPVEFFQSF